MKIQPSSSTSRAPRFVGLVAAMLLLGILAVFGCGSSHDAGPGSSAAGSSSAGTSSVGAAGSPEAGASATSADATLSDLAPNVGALVPVFAATKMNYTLRVPNGTTSVTLTPTAKSSGASIQVNGAAVASGQASGALGLPADGSASDVTVTVSLDGVAAPAAYKIHVVAQPLATGLTIHSVGDSTMANYAPTVSPNQRGWMQLLPEFLTADVTVDNGGINGTSSKSYYLSGSWDVMKLKLNAGDYVFIQFGHNDEKDAGVEGATGIGTAAWGAYHDYLTKYVNEARALGAIPILVTPVVRLAWSGASLTPVAAHDLTGNGTAVGDANYPAAMRDVATQLDCPLLDLTLASKALVEQYGPTDAKAILYVSADNTHLQVMGATVFAKLASDGLGALGLFSGHLQPELGLKVSSSTLDFGTRYLGSSLAASFSVLGLSLAPDAGTVTFTAPAGFLVGADADHFGATLDLPYTRGALPPTTVYVRFQPLSAQAYADALSSSGGAAALSVGLTGTALALPAGAAEVQASYALDSTTTGVSCVAAGSASCADESFSGLYVKDYSPLVTLLPTPTPLPTQRLSILSTPTADSWPMESDVSPDRYVEFSLAAAAGQTLSVDTVSWFSGGVGGPSMAFRAEYSTADDFSAPTELLDAPNNDTNTLTFYSFSPLASVAPGKTFRLRIYPYSKSVASKKYLSLQSLTMHGVAW